MRISDMDRFRLLDSPSSIPKRPGSKAYVGSRATLPGTRVDRVLFQMFNAERRKCGLTATELMQKILWLHYGKPSLSFEMSEDFKKE
jgi:hypothetical protein